MPDFNLNVVSHTILHSSEEHQDFCDGWSCVRVCIISNRSARVHGRCSLSKRVLLLKPCRMHARWLLLPKICNLLSIRNIRKTIICAPSREVTILKPLLRVHICLLQHLESWLSLIRNYHKGCLSEYLVVLLCQNFPILNFWHHLIHNGQVFFYQT